MENLYGTILDVCLCRQTDQIRFIQVNQGFTHDNTRYRIGDVLDITIRPSGAKCTGLWVVNVYNHEGSSNVKLVYLPSYVKGNFTKFDVKGKMLGSANGSELRYEKPVPYSPINDDRLQKQAIPKDQHHQQNIELEEDTNRYILNYRPVPLPPKSRPPIVNSHRETQQSESKTRNYSVPWAPNNNINNRNEISNKTRDSSALSDGSLAPPHVDIYKLNEMRYMNERAKIRTEPPLSPTTGAPPPPPPVDYDKQNRIPMTDFNKNDRHGTKIYPHRAQQQHESDIDFATNTPLFPRGYIRPINGRTALPRQPATSTSGIEQKVTKSKLPETTKNSLVSFLKKIGCYDELLRKKFLYLENTCKESQLLEDFQGNEVCGRVIYHFMYQGWRPNLKPPQYWKERLPPSYSVAELYLYMMWKGYQVLGRFLKSVCVDGSLMCHVLKDRILFKQLLPNGNRLNEGQLLDLRKDFFVAYSL